MNFHPCILIPTYNNPKTIRDVVLSARAHLPDIVVVNDGSDDATRAILEQIHQEGLAHVVHRAKNGGKGAAVKTGFESAAKQGFTHALQIDGDGQHDLSVVQQFLEEAQKRPESLIIGYPEYDDSVPEHRVKAREFTNFWVNLEIGQKNVVRDAMIGVRVYPLAVVQRLPVWGDRMDFDVEIAVRYAWTKRGVVNLPVPVRYLSAEEGGVSHFRMWEDNLRFAWLHTRLCTLRLVRTLLRRPLQPLLPP